MNCLSGVKKCDDRKDPKGPKKTTIGTTTAKLFQASPFYKLVKIEYLRVQLSDTPECSSANIKVINTQSSTTKYKPRIFKQGVHRQCVLVTFNCLFPLIVKYDSNKHFHISLVSIYIIIVSLFESQILWKSQYIICLSLATNILILSK